MDPRDLCSLPAPLLRMADSLGNDDLARLVDQERNERLRQAQMLSVLPPGGAALMSEMLRSHYERATGTLSDGTTGYFERGTRTDDCFAACLATCLQVPIDEVPDPRLDARLQAGESPKEINRSAWREFNSWLSQRGLRMVGHDEPPVHEARWIGIVKFPGHFNDHTLVMSRGDVLFDPVDRSRHQRTVRTYSPSDVQTGISFSSL